MPQKLIASIALGEGRSFAVRCNTAPRVIPNEVPRIFFPVAVWRARDAERDLAFLRYSLESVRRTPNSEGPVFRPAVKVGKDAGLQPLKPRLGRFAIDL